MAGDRTNVKRCVHVASRRPGPYTLRNGTSSVIVSPRTVPSATSAAPLRAMGHLMVIRPAWYVIGTGPPIVGSCGVGRQSAVLVASVLLAGPQSRSRIRNMRCAPPSRGNQMAPATMSMPAGVATPRMLSRGTRTRTGSGPPSTDWSW